MSNNHYDVPNWAGKAPPGMHLDVLKDTKLIQKLMIDDKKCYHFGRNPTMNDFCIDHASCSRVHSALVFHKHLNRAFLIDLGSTHGTFIGSVRIEANKPTQLAVDSSFHFGASTRYYILREKPSLCPRQETGLNNEESIVSHTTLPESELELDNLTEYNTAQNTRISMLGIAKDEQGKGIKRKRGEVTFKEKEEVINPEDIDPSIGKFRNLVQTSVIPKKKKDNETQLTMALSSRPSNEFHPRSSIGSSYNPTNPFFTSISLKLGIHLPNPAPDVDLEKISEADEPGQKLLDSSEDNANESLPKKKKYAKEAWPGRKHGSFLM